MSDDQQPELRWAPLEPKPSNRGRIWLIVGLVVAALLVVCVLLFFLLPRGAGPNPGASSSPTPSDSASPTPSGSATPTSEPEPEPSMTPITTPPAPVDPTVEAFREQVQSRIDSATTGLSLIPGTPSDEASGIVRTLRDDLQRLAETPVPDSIGDRWRDAVSAYSAQLDALASAVVSNTDVDAAVGSARDAVAGLQDVVSP